MLVVEEGLEMGGASVVPSPVYSGFDPETSPEHVNAEASVEPAAHHVEARDHGHCPHYHVVDMSFHFLSDIRRAGTHRAPAPWVVVYVYCLVC